MMKKMKKLAVIILAVIMVGTLMACGGSGDSSGNTPGETSGNDNSADVPATENVGSDENKEIVLWHVGTEEMDLAIWGKAIDAFNATTDSGYTISSVSIQNDTYKEKLVIAMSSGECPDVYTSWSGGPMNEYIDSGYAQPITELFNNSELPDRLLDAAIEQSKYKDDVYAVPMMSISISGIYYNTEIFEEYNLEVPKTISELEAVCDTLVEKQITPFALANAPKWTGSMYFMNLAARYGGLEPFQEAVAGTGTFEDECFIKAGETIQKWVDKGYFPEGVNSLNEDDGQARQLLYQETAAMTLAGSWYSGLMKQDSEEFAAKMDWFPFPAEDGSLVDSSILIGTVGDCFISFNCTDEKLEAAFEFATKFSEEEVVDFMVELGKIPPVKGVENKLTDETTKVIMEAVNNASSIQLWYDQYLPPSVASVHLETCQEIFGLTKTPQEAAKEFQAAMEEYNAEKEE